MTKTFSSDTYRILRTTRLLERGELDGIKFIRCVPSWLDGAARTKAVLQAVAEIAEDGVCLSNNPDFGGDYLRVAVTTEAYALVGWMLS
jgi:hypothetical protein